MPHKSPENNPLVSLSLVTKKEEQRMSLNFAMDDMFHDDVIMNSFIEAIGGQTDESGLNACNGKTDAFFN